MNKYIMYILIVACVISCIVVLFKAGLFKKKKKSEKIEKKEEPKKVETAKPEKKEEDRNFKVFKKQRLSRVSKKALKNDSRTGTPVIEKVFAKTPESVSESSADVVVDQFLSRENEELLEAVSKIEGEERKVMSLGELKKLGKEQAEKSAIEQEQQSEEYKSSRYISSGRSGEITGEYKGISIGAGANRRKSINPPEKFGKIIDPSDDQIDDIVKNDIFGDPDFMPFRNRQPVQQVQEEKDFDFSDAVIAEAILNPRFKKNKDKK